MSPKKSQTMIKSSSDFRSVAVCAAVLFIATVSGCGKKESPTALPESNPINAAPAPIQPATAPVANQPAQAVSTADADTSLAAAQTAMQKKDYEQAAAALLAVQKQRQPLTPEQGQAVRNQMVLLQQSLATAVASGDPKAKAAADLLRKSTMH